MIAAAGASYSPDVDQDTTHLVCAHGGVDAEQRRRPKVQAVQRRGGRRAAFVVSVHWLTLCLQSWVLLDEALFELPEEAGEGAEEAPGVGSEEEAGGGARREPRPRAAATAAAAQVAQTECEERRSSPECTRGGTPCSASSSSEEELPLAVLFEQAAAADVEKQRAARLQKKEQRRALAIRRAAVAGAAAGGSGGAAAGAELDSSGDELLQSASSAAASRGPVDGRRKRKVKGGGEDEGEAGAAATESLGEEEAVEDLPSYAARLGLEVYEAEENERPSLIAAQRGVELKELLYHNQKFYQQHASSKSRQQFKVRVSSP
jgi:hypothetical protein